MPKEIRSAVTKDSSSTSNDKAQREAAKREEAPADPSYFNDYDLDLKGSGSLQKVANQIQQKAQRSD